MPIFEYKCNDCNRVSEILQLPGHNGEIACKGCGSTNLTKMISAPFLPSSVGKPANDDLKCSASDKECEFKDRSCDAGSCCGQAVN
ncbi:MAG: zinc ribbon domain-containing protein [Pelotomaculum sp.]|nr:zinc ribbon domain-containing protein [Pelotomaculum sp.]